MKCVAFYMGLKFASLLPGKKMGPIVTMFANMHGLTPLMCAVAFGRHDVALALMDAGADVSLRSHNGMTAHDWAVVFGQRVPSKTNAMMDARSPGDQRAQLDSRSWCSLHQIPF